MADGGAHEAEEGRHARHDLRAGARLHPEPCTRETLDRRRAVRRGATSAQASAAVLFRISYGQVHSKGKSAHVMRNLHQGVTGGTANLHAPCQAMARMYDPTSCLFH